MSTREEKPRELLLGIFFNSEEDMTDSIYVSFDGFTFRKIVEAYKDRAPDDRDDYWIEGKDGGCLHDPGLIYKDGVFWTMSGFTPTQEEVPKLTSHRFIPMWGYSKDLIHWSLPASGSEENVSVNTSYGWPYTSYGERTNQLFDCVAPDPFLDEDGTVWVVASMGYYGQKHKVGPWSDTMKPYLVRVPKLLPNPGCGNLETEEQWKLPPVTQYEQAIPINLPKEQIADERGEARKRKEYQGDPARIETEDRIDGALYKEGGRYYLVVKRYGTVNEIWSIDSLTKVADPAAWKLVNSDFVTGFEGPCLTKYQGNYYVYTDKLADYPPGNPDGKTGIHVTCTTDLNSRWTENTKVRLLERKDGEERECTGRHGSVKAFTDPAVIGRVMELYRAAGWNYPPAGDRPLGIDMNNGWFRDGGKCYRYENGVKLASREWLDPSTGAWYWFDADGTMARNKDVFIPYNPDRTEGKWVYYGEDGHMVKGENRHGDQWNYFDLSTTKYWYYYDPITGERATGMKEIWDQSSSRNKWVYYDPEGRMLYGEQCIEGNWYWFDEVTGERKVGERYSKEKNWYRYDDEGRMIHGEYCSKEGNWYYYDIVTGIMHHGWTTLPDGRTYYYDEVTGIRQG